MSEHPDLFAVVIVRPHTGEQRLLGPYDGPQDVIDASEALTDAAVHQGLSDYCYPARVTEVPRG